MDSPQKKPTYLGQNQVSLAQLFGYLSLCGVLLALSGHTGIAATACLLIMAAALALRYGLVALLMLATALTLAGALPLADGTARGNKEGLALVRQLTVIAIAAGLSVWYARHSLSVACSR